MWIERISISNFRNLESVSFDLNRCANVIVGPNAIGKTTVLEAVRLAKAALAPRTYSEPQNAFFALGASSPHAPQRINYAAIARDLTRSIEITVCIRLDDWELQEVSSLSQHIATNIIRSRLFSQAPNPQLAMIQYLSSEEGQRELQHQSDRAKDELASIRAAAKIELGLVIDAAAGTIRGTRELDQLTFAALEGRLPAQQAMFSYFPADRSFPTGEVNVQIGGPDVAAQLESHNSQPQSKYARLKPTIFNGLVSGGPYQERLIKDFSTIFGKLLFSRELAGFQLNELGLASIRIRDKSDGREFDIDAMSSGEKGLILTFLLISQSIARGGIVLLDEPELHLNPAVCKLLLPFLVEELLVPNEIQAILCSHSPEVLSSAFEGASSKLLHIESATVISEILPQDRQEAFDALRRLGSSAGDMLFSAGTIYVEGPSDVDILQTGFGKELLKYKVTELSGRGNIESEIENLQRIEERGELTSIQCFLLDGDNRPTRLQSTNRVRVLQWDAYCLENYLIDDQAIYAALTDADIAGHTIRSRGEVPNVLKRLADRQLERIVASDVYETYSLDNPGFRRKEIEVLSGYIAIGQQLYSRVATIKRQMDAIEEKTWLADFLQKCKDREAELRKEWRGRWRLVCDGKQLLTDVRKEFAVRISPVRFSKVLMQHIKQERSENWERINRQLETLLS